MRYTRFIHGLLLLSLLALDFVIQAIFNSFGGPKILFVSQLHLLGLLMMTNKDNRFEITVKVLVVCFVMDMLHYQSFPIFYMSYGISAILIRIWYRHIGETVLELSLLMALGLFIKEAIMYAMIYIFKQQYIPFQTFLVDRTVWVIFGNLLFLPIVYRLFNYANKLIDKITYR